ncbi:outer membrane beta-barrel domain-containing protein [Peredibacter sp. HCB2-198]|uniref:outer membrane beta-barrel domain-containing protein n=1 Tax=Peredibacter sp. HCB2-198 TaxID=3383025 RepID=UPI0038B6ABB1
MLKLSIIALGLMLMLTKKTHAGEKSLYDFLWLDPDKKVYVLQNKLYKKEHSIYADIGYLANFTSKFQDTRGVAIRAGYYFHEEWGLEVFYNQYTNSNNDDFRNVRLINEAEPFIRRLNSTYGAMLIWSPFYGKINTFNQIYYFDWSFGAGVSKVNAESNIKTVTQGNVANSYTKENYTGAVLKTKVKFHLTENVHLGLEYMNTYYNAPGPKSPSDKLRTNTDVVFSVGFSY